MTETPHLLKNSLMLGPKSVRLEILDQQGKICSRATGFFIKEKDGLFLYTAWHVVTGIDFLDPKIVKPPSRRSIVVNIQSVEQRQPGITAIGGIRKIEFALYDDDGVPLWRQEPNEREHHDLNAVKIHLPKFIDAVRLPVELDPTTRDVIAFEKADILAGIIWDAGRDVVIMGYPYGYSTMDKDSPEPVFLKRSVASNRTKQAGTTLLDGGGTPGMSGAPVIVNYQDRWWLFGMYTGIIFPDYVHDGHEAKNDRSAALGLMVPIYIARAFMQVPGLYD